MGDVKTAGQPDCPPCTGGCGQGRDCQAIEQDARPPIDRASALTIIGLVLAAWAIPLSIWAIAAWKL